MKQSDKMVCLAGMSDASKKRRLPLKAKLICAFLLFTVVMLLVLWVFQTVFLDDFYQVIKKNQINKTADYICSHIEDEDIEEYISDIQERNTMTAGIYDTTTQIFRRVYSSEGYPDFGLDIMPHEVYSCYEQAKANGGGVLIDDEPDKTTDRFFGQNLPADMPQFDRRDGTRLTCVRIIEVDVEIEYMLILRSPITPVTSTVETLRIQLIIVSAILGVMGVFFAIIISANIARPLAKTNKGAKELAKQNYSVVFENEGYREILELNETLNFAATELSAVDRLRRELIANISHDLRTPLTMIGGYAEVMRDIPGENSPENLQVIIDESQRLSQLVTDLLDLSKLESGNMPMCMESFCLTDSVRSILTRYSKLISSDGYKLDFVHSEDIEVIGDEIRLSQVIYNLINNAINYCGEDKAVEVKQIASGNRVRIEITDKGEGIEPEDLKNIWDRYYRVDKEHKSAVIGSGLGLSIAKNVLLQHKAHFGVKSAKGVGSTFWFELPIQSIKPKDITEE